MERFFPQGSLMNSSPVGELKEIMQLKRRFDMPLNVVKMLAISSAVVSAIY
jgi:hypothetical protein